MRPNCRLFRLMAQVRRSTSDTLGILIRDQSVRQHGGKISVGGGKHMEKSISRQNQIALPLAQAINRGYGMLEMRIADRLSRVSHVKRSMVNQQTTTSRGLGFATPPASRTRPGWKPVRVDENSTISAKQGAGSAASGISASNGKTPLSAPSHRVQKLPNWSAL
jgi:hypothetical protein